MTMATHNAQHLLAGIQIKQTGLNLQSSVTSASVKEVEWKIAPR